MESYLRVYDSGTWFNFYLSIARNEIFFKMVFVLLSQWRHGDGEFKASLGYRV